MSAPALPEAPARNADAAVRSAYAALKATHSKLATATEAHDRFVARKAALPNGWLGSTPRQNAENRKAHSKQMDIDFYTTQYGEQHLAFVRACGQVWAAQLRAALLTIDGFKASTTDESPQRQQDALGRIIVLNEAWDRTQAHAQFSQIVALAEAITDYSVTW